MGNALSYYSHVFTPPAQLIPVALTAYGKCQLCCNNVQYNNNYKTNKPQESASAKNTCGTIKFN